mgnify:FL=1
MEGYEVESSSGPSGAGVGRVHKSRKGDRSGWFGHRLRSRNLKLQITMAMTAMHPDQIKAIAAFHSIDYETVSSELPNVISTKMSRDFNIPQEDIFAIFADLEGHPKFLPHLKAVKVIKNADIGNVLQDNQVLIVEGLEEGGSRMGIKLFTLFPPNRIEGRLLTDPFPEDVSRSDPKKGTINWIFDKLDDNKTKMTIESTFDPVSNKFFNRGMVDHVWINFFENTMIEFGELDPVSRFTNLLGERTEKFKITFNE